MRLSDLEKEGIPRRVIDIWRARQGESLLPVQKLAVRKGLLKDREKTGRPPNMIISAPTSSGKSFCAELAAVRALTARRKAVLLFPLKSLAEENHRRLKETFAPLGVRCLIATGDHPENDARFLSGNYQLAVAIYEKLDLLLALNLDALKNIGTVVIDEFQMIAEPGRGAVLERLVTRILASTYNPSLVALSAVLGGRGAEKLAAWINAELVEETARPVDLIRGVAVEGSYRFRSYNSGEDGDEPFRFAETESGDDPADSRLNGFIEQVKADDGSTLVFMKSRRDTVSLAFRLAAAVSWPPATAALEGLDDEEPSFLIRSLRQALGRGVAFHNSDLSPQQRKIVEKAFIDKEVKALFSTTTLAMGVNLPADTVYLETVKYMGGTYDGRPSLVPISRIEFDNMTGRAGRLGWKSDRPARAIVMAESDFDRDILWENYIAPHEPEPVESVFETLPPEDWLLHFIVCGLVRNRDDLERVLARTLWRDGARKPFAFEPALERLTADRLVMSTDGAFAATPRGRAVVAAGLSTAEAEHYGQKLAHGYPETVLGWTALALSAPSWVLPPGLLTFAEHADSAPLKMLYRDYDYALAEAACLLPENHRREPLSYRQAAALKALLLLQQWAGLVPTRRLEETFQVHLGQIMALGETAAHLVTALAVLLEACDHDSRPAALLRGHAFSLRHGLPAEFLPMHRSLGEILNRADFSELHRAGVTGLFELARKSPEERAALIKNESKWKFINNKIKSFDEEVDMQLATSSSRPQVFAGPELVEIDGSFERERYLVRINGFPVRLTGKSFKYFTKLAWSRLNMDSGWIYKEDIEVGFNQARYLYRMKNEISSGLNFAWPVIENNRLGYYRLNLSPGKIKINRENLKTHPDYEIRQLVQENGSSIMTGERATVN
ncbi:MAG: DEAD/DEAH box helicase [Candidatus Zixiibacteriota bacterium]